MRWQLARSHTLREDGVLRAFIEVTICGYVCTDSGFPGGLPNGILIKSIRGTQNIKQAQNQTLVNKVPFLLGFYCFIHIQLSSEEEFLLKSQPAFAFLQFCSQLDQRQRYSPQYTMLPCTNPQHAPSLTLSLSVCLLPASTITTKSPASLPRAYSDKPCCLPVVFSNHTNPWQKLSADLIM